jgi:hypothetical protein
MNDFGDEVQADVVDSLARSLQPLVAELQNAGVGVGEWVEAVKISSFRAARSATNAESGRTVYTRMSVRTGMTRTELQRLRQSMLAGQTLPPRMGGRQRTARVLAGWRTDRDYFDAHGLPRALRALGPRPSLQSLIRTYAGDVPVSSVLAELQRQALIVATNDGRYLPRADFQEPALASVRRLERALRALQAEPRADYFLKG